MSRNKLFERYKDWHIKDKHRALRNFVDILLNKTVQIFEYRNLPETIPEKILEEMLQTNGNVFFTKVNGEYYVFTGGLGGEPDVYYRPTLYTIANPALNLSKSYTIGKDGVLIRNDWRMRGLLPLIHKYGVLLVESDISINNAIIATRDYNAFSALTDNARASAEEYQRKIEAGDSYVIGEKSLIESIKRHPTNPNNNTMRDLKEMYQYIKAMLYSDLGMKTAYNFKSQYVSDQENVINDDTLLPLIDNMLDMRQEALAEINEMYGLDIQVKLKGTWELQQEEVEQAISALEEGINNEESESSKETSDNMGESTGVDETEEETEEENDEEDKNNEEDQPEVTVKVNINTDKEDEEDEGEAETKRDTDA